MGLEEWRMHAGDKKQSEQFWGQLFNLDSKEGITLQAQIRRGFVAAILDGRLPEGVRLPSSRVLARQLDVARNTVSAAYRQLTDDGFIRARPRSGYVVRGGTTEERPPPLAAQTRGCGHASCASMVHPHRLTLQLAAKHQQAP